MGGENFLGAISLFAGNYEIEGWRKCDGDYLPVKDHPALFAVIGYQYGQEVKDCFRLPNLDYLVSQPNSVMWYYICVDGEFPIKP